jgi:hypothetical protein
MSRQRRPGQPADHAGHADLLRTIRSHLRNLSPHRNNPVLKRVNRQRSEERMSTEDTGGSAPLLVTLGDADAAVCTDGICEVPVAEPVGADE